MELTSLDRSLNFLEVTSDSATGVARWQADKVICRIGMSEQIKQSRHEGGMFDELYSLMVFATIHAADRYSNGTNRPTQIA